MVRWLAVCGLATGCTVQLSGLPGIGERDGREITVAGEWAGECEFDGDFAGELAFDLDQDGHDVDGTVEIDGDGDEEDASGSFYGSELELAFEFDEYDVSYDLDAELDGDRLEGELWAFGWYNDEDSWEATFDCELTRE